eukprot:5067958-Pleurochrysis_carterae.AAC.1
MPARRCCASPGWLVQLFNNVSASLLAGDGTGRTRRQGNRSIVVRVSYQEGRPGRWRCVRKSCTNFKACMAAAQQTDELG